MERFLSSFQKLLILQINFACFFIDSDGCIHVHPDDLKTIDQILKKLGVIERQNTFGKLPYPYKPQGLLSIEEIFSSESVPFNKGSIDISTMTTKI